MSELLKTSSKNMPCFLYYETQIDLLTQQNKQLQKELDEAKKTIEKLQKTQHRSWAPKNLLSDTLL